MYFLSEDKAKLFYDWCLVDPELGGNSKVEISMLNRSHFTYHSDIDFRVFLCKAFNIKFDELDSIIGGADCVTLLLSHDSKGDTKPKVGMVRTWKEKDYDCDVQAEVIDFDDLIRELVQEFDLRLGEKAIDTLTENQVLTFSDFTKL